VIAIIATVCRKLSHEVLSSLRNQLSRKTISIDAQGRSHVDQPAPSGGIAISEKVRMNRSPSRCAPSAHFAKWPARAVLAALLLAAAPVASAATPAHVSVSFEQTIADARYPELVYWFITPETFAPDRAAQDMLLELPMSPESP
jgi:hypothetical protein